MPPSPTPRQPWRIGLTGGIGSGKSTVAALLAERGAAVIDADALSRATTAPGGAALPAIAAAFGRHMIAADGALDRAAMRALIYHDSTARKRLEAIVHPLVSAASDRQAAAAQAAGAALLVFDVPLLVEAGPRWRGRVDCVLVVDCPPAVQVQRVMARNALPVDEVERIIAAQIPRAQRLAAADAVLFNGAEVSLHALRTQLEAWAEQL